MTVIPSKPPTPAGQPITGPAAVPTVQFGAWLDYVNRWIAAVASTFNVAPGPLGNFANDAAAAAGGVAVGSLYRNGSVVQIRVV